MMTRDPVRAAESTLTEAQLLRRQFVREYGDGFRDLIVLRGSVYGAEFAKKKSAPGETLAEFAKRVWGSGSLRKIGANSWIVRS